MKKGPTFLGMGVNLRSERTFFNLLPLLMYWGSLWDIHGQIYYNQKVFMVAIFKCAVSPCLDLYLKFSLFTSHCHSMGGCKTSYARKWWCRRYHDHPSARRVRGTKATKRVRIRCLLSTTSVYLGFSFGRSNW